MMPILINDVPIECINQAAITNHVPATLILSIMKKENGQNGQAVRNKNGTFDLGVLQINTSWLPTLTQYGYTKQELQFNPCKNVMAGAWILAKGIAEGKTLWTGIGNYNSHTPVHNQAYHQDINMIYSKLNKTISS